tara:strand:+ start:2967 stop:3296 length:330 start_codon:yes stop_codon:yes gene_type:complete
VYNILTHKTTTFITLILLRPVKGGCCISQDIEFGLVSRLNTISQKLKEILNETKTKSGSYTEELDDELKDIKTKLNTLLRYIRDIKAKNKMTMQGKVKDTKNTSLFDFN